MKNEGSIPPRPNKDLFDQLVIPSDFLIGDRLVTVYDKKPLNCGFFMSKIRLLLL